MVTKKKCLRGDLFNNLNEAFSYYESHLSEEDFKCALFDVAVEIGELKDGETGYIRLPMYSSEYNIFSFSKVAPRSGSYIKVDKIIGVEYLLDFSAMNEDFVIVGDDGTATTFPDGVIRVYEDYLSAYSDMDCSDMDIIPLDEYAKSIGKNVEELVFRYF